MRERFFKKKVEFLTVKQVTEIVGAKVLDDKNLDKKIHDVATLKNASKDDISFLNSGSYSQSFKESKAGVCLVKEEYAPKAPQDMVVLIHENPYYAYSLIAKEFYEEELDDFAIKNCFFHKNKNIHASAKIGKNCTISSLAYIGPNVEIGDNCYIDASAVISRGCIIGNNTRVGANAVISHSKIGNNCYIYPGAKIGQDGFGFAHDKGVNHKIIQLGMVEISDEVEIGANTTVDRGAIDNTKIGKGTKIDNLVQIAHNVIIGQGSVVAGCTAVAGSAEIGNYVQVGGNASIAGHIKINDQAQVAGMSGLIRDVEKGEAVAGIPAHPIRKWHKINASLAKMVK